MRKAIIFSNTDLTNIDKIKDAINFNDYIICADGGVHHALGIGLIPHVVLGDFDSTPESLREKLASFPIRWIPQPTGKNQFQTDSEFAIQHALDEGYTEILIAGFTGTRLDHMIGNFFLFAQTSMGKKISISILDYNQTLYFTESKLQIQGKKNDILSLIPFKVACKGVTTSGLQWELTNALLKLGSTLGISNVFTRPIIKVTVKKGALVVIHTRI